MAVDFPPIVEVAQEMVVQQLDRKRRGRAVAVGALIILSDGSQCQLLGYDAQGRPICQPPRP